MSSQKLVILGTGTYFPKEKRTNDWWSQDTVDGWGRSLQKMVDAAKQAASTPTPGSDIVLAAMQAELTDPFGGVRSRYIAAADELSSQMEAQAALEALDAAEIGTQDVGLVLSQTIVPDFMAVNHAAIVQHRAGLPNSCMAMTVDGVCLSLLSHLSVAEGLLLAGRAKYAVLTQSSNVTRLMPQQHPSCGRHGDGATAVVVGLSDSGNGLLETRTYTDGSRHGAFVLGCQGGRWYDDKAVTAYSADRAASAAMLVDSADIAQNTVGTALSESGFSPSDVKFYAAHQGLSWLRSATQEHLGLNNARHADTYPWAGSVVGANLALQLHVAQKEGLLHNGDLVAIFGEGSGLTAVGTLLKWGR